MNRNYTQYRYIVVQFIRSSSKIRFPAAYRIKNYRRIIRLNIWFQILANLISIIVTWPNISPPFAGQEVFMTHCGREVKGTVEEHDDFEVS